MNKHLLITLAALGGIVFAAVAADEPSKEKTKPTPEQRQLRRQMLTKYDLNADKKLDKQELAKISAEDRKKMQEAGLGERKGAAKRAKNNSEKQTAPANKKAK